MLKIIPCSEHYYTIKQLMSKENTSKEERTIRDRVLLIVSESRTPLTGREISGKARLSYKQTVDALNALNNHGKVQRLGRKCNARWCAYVQDKAHETFAFFDNAFLAISRKNANKKNK